MLKYLICGAVALGAFGGAGAAMANVYVNGTHYGAGTHTITYPQTTSTTYAVPAATAHSTGAANCCAGVDLVDTGVVVSQPAATTYQPAPVAVETYTAAPADSELIYIEPAPAPVVTPTPAVVAQPAVVHQPAMPKHKPAYGGWHSQVYVGARGGWTSMRDTEFSLVGSEVDNEYDDDGYNIAAVVGWRGQVQRNIGYRVEAELGYQTAEIDSHTVGGTTFSGRNAFGDTNVLYGFVNTYLDVPVTSRLTAFAGGGAGIGQVEFDGHGVGPTGVVMDDEDTVFGYHLDAGVSYDVTPRLALEAMYRYTSFVDAELTAEDGTTSETDVDSHNVLIGARYGF